MFKKAQMKYVFIQFYYPAQTGAHINTKAGLTYTF